MRDDEAVTHSVTVPDGVGVALAQPLLRPERLRDGDRDAVTLGDGDFVMESEAVAVEQSDCVGKTLLERDVDRVAEAHCEAVTLALLVRGVTLDKPDALPHPEPDGV